MSIIAEVLDRITGFAVLNSKVQDLSREVIALRGVVADHERALAEIRGQNKAFLQVQAAATQTSRKKSEKND